MSQNLNPLTNGSYWGPTNETPDEISFEKLFLASCYCSAIAFGMQFTLYLGCLQVLWQSTRTRISYLLMIYSTLLCISNLLYTVDGYIIVQLAYISNRNFPGGVVSYIGASVALPSSIISITSIVAGIFLADLLLLWRVRVIWRATITGRNWIAQLPLVLPAILILASLIIGIIWNIVSALPDGFFGPEAGKIAMSYFALTLTSNVLMTGMIVFRMWSYQSVLRQTLGNDHTSQYTSISTMFVESAGLYSIMSILVLGSYAANSNVNQIFLGLAPGLQLISSYLIIWRVANGRAWSRETITTSADPSTSLRFNRPGETGGTTTNGYSSRVTGPSSIGPDTITSRDVGIRLKSKESGSLEKVHDDRIITNRLGHSASSIDE